MRHASFVASCEVLADYGRDAQRESQRPEINYQKERAAERYCGQRQRILAAEASHHGRVGELRGKLSCLRQDDGHGQREDAFVVIDMSFEVLHGGKGNNKRGQTQKPHLSRCGFYCLEIDPSGHLRAFAGYAQSHFAAARLDSNGVALGEPSLDDHRRQRRLHLVEQRASQRTRPVARVETLLGQQALLPAM